MRSIVFIICGEATPNLFTLHYYFLLPKNPVHKFLVKSEE